MPIELTLTRPDYISIHTPHTRCDDGDALRYEDMSKISIHTPHTRCD